MKSQIVRPRERSANIFINYRREDSAGHAGRLFDGLSSHFPGRLFMDVDTLEPGVDFVEAIEQAVGSCEVLIVVIGREWLTIEDAAGNRRLDNPGDFVRLEVESALARKIRVIPVLVQDTPMPRAEELPPSLARLARRNAIELSDDRWAYDVDRLAQTIQEILQEKEAFAPSPAMAAPAAPAVNAARPRAWALSLAALVLVAGVVLASVVWLRQAPSAEDGSSKVQEAAVNGASDPGSVAPAANPVGPQNAEAVSSGAPAGNGLPAVPAVHRVEEGPARPEPAIDSRPVESAAGATVQAPRATIISPRHGDKVGSSILVQGAVSGLADGQLAFLCFRTPEGTIYPRGKLTPNADGLFSLEARSSKQDFETFVVVSTGLEAAEVLNDPGPREHGLRSLPPGASITGSVVALRRQGKIADIFKRGGKQRPDASR